MSQIVVFYWKIPPVLIPYLQSLCNNWESNLLGESISSTPMRWQWANHKPNLLIHILCFTHPPFTFWNLNSFATRHKFYDWFCFKLIQMFTYKHWQTFSGAFDCIKSEGFILVTFCPTRYTIPVNILDVHTSPNITVDLTHTYSPQVRLDVDISLQKRQREIKIKNSYENK